MNMFFKVVGIYICREDNGDNGEKASRGGYHYDGTNKERQNTHRV